MLTNPLPKLLTNVCSLVIGVNLAVQAVLAGAPIAESLLGGTIAAVGVSVSYAIARRPEVLTGFALPEGLRRRLTWRSLGRAATGVASFFLS